MAQIETPPRVVTSVKVTCIQSVSGQQFGLEVERLILTDPNGIPLPKPMSVAVHPCDQMFILAEALKNLSVQIGRAISTDQQANG